MSQYKPYPAYKDSGVEWLGRVPEHWEVTPLKYEAEFVNGAAFKPEQWSEKGTPIIRIENLNGSLNFNCFVGEMDSRYHVEQGDLLFGWSGNRGTSFGPFIWPHEGRHYLNQHIFRICNFKFDKSWFYWSLKAVTEHVEDQAHGIIGMVHITKGDLGAIKIATPVLAEQQVIAAHLDRETARIDALVVKKTRFIELLREKRQALITHAVTKGLDPKVKMKDSGVEWLGEVPEHWSIVPLKWCFECLDGKRVPLNSEQRADIKGEVPYWGSGGVVDYINKFIFDEPLVLLGEDGAPFFDRDRPVAYAIDGKSWINNHIHVLRPLTDYPITWFVHALNCVEYRHYIDGSTRDKLTQDDMKSIALVIPGSPDEANQAVAHIDSETARIDALLGKTEHSITLLKERRSALITAAVTGQIDLREAV